MAQQPTPPAPIPPPIAPPDYGAPINNEQAKAVAGAAFAEAKKNNWRMAFTIVGPAGEPVYFEKMDGTQHASVEISRAKARTSVLFRRPSKAFADQFAAGNTTFMTFPDAPIASEGGVLIIAERQDHRRDRRERRHRAAGRRCGDRRGERGEVSGSPGTERALATAPIIGISHS